MHYMNEFILYYMNETRQQRHKESWKEIIDNYFWQLQSFSGMLTAYFQASNVALLKFTSKLF